MMARPAVMVCFAMGLILAMPEVVRPTQMMRAHFVCLMPAPAMKMWIFV
jgi:hypothetical protein